MADEKPHRGKYMFLCGSETQYCSGGKVSVNAGLRASGVTRAHPDAMSAYKCHASMLVAKGYISLGGHAFQSPDPSEGVRILTKPSKFGAILRPGKSGRQMTRKVRGATRSGHVASY